MANDPNRPIDTNYTPETERPRFPIGGEPRQVVTAPPSADAAERQAPVARVAADSPNSPTLEITLSAPGFGSKVVTASPSLADLAAGPDAVIDRYVRPALHALLNPPDAVITR